MSRVISFHYTLTNAKGHVIDSSQKRGSAFSFLEGGGQILPGLEAVVTKLAKGDKKRVELKAAEAYGLRNESMVLSVPKAKLPTEELKIGDRFRGGPDEHAPLFTVVEIGAVDVKLDGNHPLAGEDLAFEVEMGDAREATAEELQHGHAHGEHGHSH